MSSDRKKLPFDPLRFAMPSTGAEEFGTRKIRSIIPVNKPGKMEWVHLLDHPDFLIPGAALLDLQDGGRVYLVVPEIAAQLDDDEPPHLNWSSAMFRKRRTDNDQQTTEAGRDYHEVEAS